MQDSHSETSQSAGPLDLPTGAFRWQLWAPRARRVDLVLFDGDDHARTIPMQPQSGGYFAHEAPEKLNLADVRSQLGPKWKRIDYDVNGEWSYYLILDQFLNSEVESKRAAAGWAGDRYAVYEAPATDDVFITQLSVWDTENEAREFFDAYAKRTKLRYADSKAAELVASGERRQWTTSQGGVAMEMKGKRILILEGIPGNSDVNELLRVLWQ